MDAWWPRLLLLGAWLRITQVLVLRNGGRT